MIRHKSTERCNHATEIRLWRRDLDLVQRVGEMNFILYDSEEDSLVEREAQFQYLGMTLEHTYNYWTAVHRTTFRVR